VRSTVWVMVPKRGTCAGVLIGPKRNVVLTGARLLGDEAPLVLFPSFKGGQLVRDKGFYGERKDRQGALLGKLVAQDLTRDLPVLERAEEAAKDAGVAPFATMPFLPGQLVHAVGHPDKGDGLWAFASGTVRQVRPKRWLTLVENAVQEREARVVETLTP